MSDNDNPSKTADRVVQKRLQTLGVWPEIWHTIGWSGCCLP